MVNLKDAAEPGGWATPQTFRSLQEAREQLALLEKFKHPGANCCVLQEYIVRSPIPVRTGVAGPLSATEPRSTATMEEPDSSNCYWISRWYQMALGTNIFSWD